MDPIKVGNYLLSLRKEKNLTQEELAERINVSSKTISKWEVGTNIPDTVSLYKLSKEYNVPIQDILNGGEVHDESENNDSIKNGINFYNRLFKRKVMKIVVLIIIGIVGLFSILYTVSNYNRVQVYDIDTISNEFKVKGYLITNSKESIFFIDKIRYLGNDVGTIDSISILSYGITIKHNINNNIYYINGKDFEYPKKLPNVLDEIKISFIVKNNNLYNNVIIIKFIDDSGKMYEHKIDLIMKKRYSNNKIMYQ